MSTIHLMQNQQAIIRTPGLGPIEFVGSNSSIVNSQTSAGTYSMVSLPAGIQAGDLILVTYCYRDHSSIGATPSGSGWSTVQSKYLANTGPTDSASNHGTRVWHKIADGTETDIQLYYNPITGYQKYPRDAIGVMVFRYAQFLSIDANGQSTNGNCPSVTIEEGQVLVAGHWTMLDAGTGTQNTPPTGMTLAEFNRPTGNPDSIRMFLAYQIYEISGMTGSKQWPYYDDAYEVSASIVLSNG